MAEAQKAANNAKIIERSQENAIAKAMMSISWLEAQCRDLLGEIELFADPG